MMNMFLEKPLPEPPSPAQQDRKDLEIDFAHLNSVIYSTIPLPSENGDGYFQNIGSRESLIGDVLIDIDFDELPVQTPSKLMLRSSRMVEVFNGASLTDLSTIGQHLQDIFSEDWWMDFQNPSKAELRHICDVFGIHELTFEDILAQEVSEKLEQYPAYQFVSLISFYEDKGDGDLGRYCVYLCIFPRGILSFCFQDNQHTRNVERRVSRHNNEQSLKSEWIFYCFADDIVDNCLPLIEHLAQEARKLENQVYTTREGAGKRYMQDMAYNRKKVLSLKRLLAPKHIVIQTFAAQYVSTAEPNDSILLYINDIEDHLETMLSTLRHCETLLHLTMDTFKALLTDTFWKSRWRLYRSMYWSMMVNIFVMLGMAYTMCFGMNFNHSFFYHPEDPETGEPARGTSEKSWWIVSSACIWLLITLAWLLTQRVFVIPGISWFSEDTTLLLALAKMRREKEGGRSTEVPLFDVIRRKTNDSRVIACP